MSKSTIISLACLMMAGALISGCGGHGMFHKSPEERIDFIADRISSDLNLTKNQQEILDRIKDEVIMKMTDYHSKMTPIRKEGLSLVRRESLTADDVNKFIAKREAMHKELKPFVVDKIVEFHGILTVEQKEKLAERIEELHERFGH